jgi:hypothetical protein
MVLDKKIKLQLMLEQLKLTNELLKNDCLRPYQRLKYQEERDVLKKDIDDMIIDLFNIIKN